MSSVRVKVMIDDQLLRSSAISALPSERSLFTKKVFAVLN